MRASYPSDEFLENNGLTQPCTTEQTGFTTANERREQVDDFDARFKDFGVGRKFGNRWGFAVNRPLGVGLDVTALVDGFTKNVEDPTEGSFADRDRHGATGIDAVESTHQTVGATESNATNLATT